jgi:hypothetical protein
MEADPNRLTLKSALKVVDLDRVLCPHCAKRFEIHSFVIDIFKAFRDLLDASHETTIVVDSFGTFSAGEFEGGPDAKQAYYKLFARKFRTIKFMAARSVVRQMTDFGAPRNKVQQNRAAEKQAAQMALKQKLLARNTELEDTEIKEYENAD